MRSGFTLIELIVAVGLFAMIMTSVTMLLFASLSSTKKASNATKAKSEGAYALNLMTNLARYATVCSASTGKRVEYQDSLGNLSYFEYSNTPSRNGIFLGVVGGAESKLIDGKAFVIKDADVYFGCPTPKNIQIKFSLNGIIFENSVVLRNAQ